MDFFNKMFGYSVNDKIVMQKKDIFMYAREKLANTLHPGKWRDRMKRKMKAYYSIFIFKGLTKFQELPYPGIRTPSLEMQAFATYWWRTTQKNRPTIHTFQTLKENHHLLY